MSKTEDLLACIKGISQIEDIIKTLKQDKGLLQIALDDKTTLLKSCEAALEERDKIISEMTASNYKRHRELLGGYWVRNNSERWRKVNVNTFRKYERLTDPDIQLEYYS